nr:LOW QUALITY PROTEIN: 40S ribosomal protein SA-like [Aedes albopictus]
MLVATTHFSSTTVDFQIKSYVYTCRPDGLQIIHLGRLCEKLLLAVRCITSIDYLGELFAIASHSYGQRNHYTETTPTAGRFTPGSFTKQILPVFREPRLLIITDHLTDHQLVTEASYINNPAIVFGNTESPVKFVDIVIPPNNKPPAQVFF